MTFGRNDSQAIAPIKVTLPSLKYSFCFKTLLYAVVNQRKPDYK